MWLRPFRINSLFLFFILSIYGTHGIAQTPTVRFVNADGETLADIDYVIHNRTVYLPMDSLEKVFDPEIVIQYQRPINQITIKTNGKELKFRIGRTTVELVSNNKTITLPKPPTNIDGQRMLPIVFFTDILPHINDIEVLYNSQLQRVRIIPKTVWQDDDNEDLKEWIIIIDPGHGGEDNYGSVSQNGIREKDVVLKVATEIHRLSSHHGISIRLTRENDKNISHMQRVQTANKTQGKLFISLHCNNSFSTKHKGMRLCINNPKGLLRNRIKPETIIGRNRINILTQSNYLKQSKDFADIIENELNFLFEEPIEVSEFPIFPIKDVNMPAVLLELGYLSNLDDAIRLTKPEHITEIAKAIIRSIQKFTVSESLPEQETED